MVRMRWRIKRLDATHELWDRTPTGSSGGALVDPILLVGLTFTSSKWPIGILCPSLNLEQKPICRLVACLQASNVVLKNHVTISTTFVLYSVNKRQIEKEPTPDACQRQQQRSIIWGGWAILRPPESSFNRRERSQPRCSGRQMGLIRRLESRFLDYAHVVSRSIY